MDKITPQYLSLADLSKRSSLSVKTLRTFLSHHEHPLPHIRLPRKILVDVAEFDAWLARFRVTRPGPDLDKLVDDFMSKL
jgi:hypothetical protein